MAYAALVVFAASSLSVPSLGMDMVHHLLRKLPDVNETGQALAADVDLWVAPDGSVTSCDIPRSVGDEGLVQLLCPALEGVDVGSSTSSDGEKVYGDLSVLITAFPDRDFSTQRRLVSQLRQKRQSSDDQRYVRIDGLRWRDDWKLLVEVGEDGRVRHCGRMNRKVRKKAEEIACSFASKMRFEPRAGDEGAPVRFVKSLEVLTAQ